MQHGSQPPGRSGGVDRGPTLASQGGATIGESFSVVLVEETPGGSAGELPSSLPGEVCSVLDGAAPPAGVKDDMNDVACCCGGSGTV